MPSGKKRKRHKKKKTRKRKGGMPVSWFSRGAIAALALFQDPAGNYIHPKGDCPGFVSVDLECGACRIGFHPCVLWESQGRSELANIKSAVGAYVICEIADKPA